MAVEGLEGQKRKRMESAAEIAMEFSKNPLICPICQDYYTEPCILGCYHTFCARCLRGRDSDRRLVCPLCRHPTVLKEGHALPPPDSLMRQLIEIANSENPPCSNCDKRDRANMFYCNTCGQALCMNCRDNTHRAKMFAQHDIMHMNRCTKEAKRCPQHGEQFIMYSPLQNAMLCVNCFREQTQEVRAQCVDIETAHSQAAKRLERGQNAIMDLQSSVRDGIVALKGLMDELRRNMDTEKHTINTFCQGMQEAMAKTHAAMIMEVQRQYESKERVYKSQLLALGTVMPVLQLHLVLCTTFTSAANKYQFLELCPSLIERLAAVGQLSQPVRSLQSSSIRTNYRSEFAQSLEPWIGQAAVSAHLAELASASSRNNLFEGVGGGAAPLPPTRKQQGAMKSKVLDASDSSFSTHCRSFESQIRELNSQFNVVKERVGELHKDISAIRRAQNPPLTLRYEHLTRDCQLLDKSLERQQAELERMAQVFDKSWEEQLWRLRIEQEVFSCQRADLVGLRNELKHLNNVAQQLEPYIRSFVPTKHGQGQQQEAAEQAQHLQNILDHIGRLQAETGKIPRSRSRILGQLIEKMRPPDRERSKSTSQMSERCGTTSASGAGSRAATPSSKKAFVPQQLNIERLESHIKEKIQDIMCRRQSKSDTETTERESGAKRNITYKKIVKSCDKLNGCAARRSFSSSSQHQQQQHQQQQQQQQRHQESRSSPGSPKRCTASGQVLRHHKSKVYPYSDGEDNVFYSMHDSAESLSTSSRRSSCDATAATTDKTLVVVINRKNGRHGTQQRSWETFPPKHRRHASQETVCEVAKAGGSAKKGFGSGAAAGGQHRLVGLAPPVRKADSFEGHEEAVKSLVAAVQETRRKPKGGQ